MAVLCSRFNAGVGRGATAAAPEGYEQRGLLAFPKGGVPPQLRYAALGAATELADELALAASWACFFDGHPLPTDADGFAGRIAERHHRLATRFGDALAGAQAVLAHRAEAVRRIAALTSPAFAANRADMEAHLGRLAPAEFLSRTPIERLPDVARYLNALSHRAANLQGRVRRDLDHLAEAARWQTRLEALAAVAPEAVAPAAVLVEEYRVSLFCQRLSVGKASPQRLERLLAPLEKEAGLR